MAQGVFKNCSVCKKEIALLAEYYVCSVSTCNSRRTGLTFCSMSCFERHLPGARHRDAAAITKTAPSTVVPAANEGPRRRIIASSPSSTPGSSSAAKEILIVASKLKAYVKERADMNTSASVMDILSNKVRQLCDDAIDEARANGRKTVLDRDFK